MLWILEHVDQLNTEAVLSLLPQISEGRRARVLSITHIPAKVRSVLAELLLRRALREEYGLAELPKIETEEKGKPFFPDHPEIHFNLSHCKYAVSCALDRAPVGVDAEALGRLLRPGAQPVSETGDPKTSPGGVASTTEPLRQGQSAPVPKLRAPSAPGPLRGGTRLGPGRGEPRGAGPPLYRGLDLQGGLGQGPGRRHPVRPEIHLLSSGQRDLETIRYIFPAFFPGKIRTHPLFSRPASLQVHKI